MGVLPQLQPSISGLELTSAPTVADRPLVPQPFLEAILCARHWAQFLSLRNMLSDERDP